MRHLSIHAAKLSLSVVLLVGFGLSGFVDHVATTVSAAAAPSTNSASFNRTSLVTRTNVALSSNGSTATASSILDAGRMPDGAINGDRRGVNWGAGGGWHDSTENTYPDWLQVDFAGTKTIDEIDVFTVQDNYQSPAEPTTDMTFSTYGVTGFDVQYWTGSAWATVPAGSITGSNKVWRKISFTAVATTKIRIVVNNALASYSRLTEVEAWGDQTVTPTPRTNVALASNGSTATASSILDAGRMPDGAINGDRRGINWGAGGGWHDSTENTYPDWLQVDFAGMKTIDEIDVFTVQDNYTSPVEPTDTQTFTNYGVTDFDVQYWTGSAWATVPGGSITGNNKVWSKISFPAIATSKIRVVVNSSLWSYSRLTEVEAWGDQTVTPTPRTNVALASNGSTATASSILDAGRMPDGAINGDRRGINWGAGGGWHDSTENTYPDWLQVDFAGTKTIDEIDVFTLQDNYTSPAEPTTGMTFSTYGVTGFDVQYWTGSAWATVPAGSINGSNKVWSKISFPAIATTKIRVVVNSSLWAYSRLTEVEAWGDQTGLPTPTPTVTPTPSPSASPTPAPSPSPGGQGNTRLGPGTANLRLRAAADFDGDGLADFAVFRPENNQWLITKSSGGTITSPFGLASHDYMTPGDYDGDGRADLAVFRDDDATWWRVNSSTGAVTSRQWGAKGDEPVARDYDGDGKTDLAVVRRSGGKMTWLILRSSDQQTVSTEFGLSTDFASPGDYDGDGKFDITIQRPGATRASVASFQTLGSSAGQQSFQWGVGGDLVVPGDYDGDGKTDYAVVREGPTPTSPLTWYISKSSGGSDTFEWGITGSDLTAQNDYDGDGKTDLAVWRNSDGTFLIRKSSGGTASFHWGQPSDYPITSYDTH